MKIVLNGKINEDFDTPLSIAELLGRLGLSGQPVLVELDEIALRPRDYPETLVTDGSKLEIIRVAAGG
ncbi:MAG: sulfur carrier protein ThiS [Verrucomicrobiales bacterium]